MLRQAIERVRLRVSHVEGRAWIKTAVGLAVPAVESWYLLGMNQRYSEQEWIDCRLRRIPPAAEIRRHKQLVYGTDRPSIKLETERAIAAVTELVKDLSHLEACFPNGFGALVRELRSWCVASG